MKQRNILGLLVLTCVVLFTLTIRGIPGNPDVSKIKNNLDQATKPFELSPERGRYLLTQSLAENKSFSLSQNLADAAYPDVGYSRGKFYVFFPPGTSILAVPFYFAGKYFNLSQVGAFSLSSLMATLTMIMIFLIAKNILKLPQYLSFFASLIYGFASTSWSYAITLYQHQLTAFLILSCFYCAWKFKQSKRGVIWAILIGFAYALAIFSDYSNAVLLLPVMIYFLLNCLKITKNKRVLKITLKPAIFFSLTVFALMTAVHGYYNQVNFGKVTKTSGGLLGYKTIKEEKILDKPDTETQLKNLGSQKSEIGFFKEEDIPRSFSIMLFSRDRGIFLYTPIFILGILGLIKSLKKSSLETEILLAILGFNLFLYSSWSDPWGGWAYGPRYLIPSMTVLSIFVSFFINSFRKKIISFILFVVSCALALLGALTTNAVPPKIEADFLHMKYNFLLNLDYLKSGASGSYFYNTYISTFLNLTQYYFIILIILSCLGFWTLFLLPKIKKA